MDTNPNTSQKVTDGTTESQENQLDGLPEQVDHSGSENNTSSAETSEASAPPAAEPAEESPERIIDELRKAKEELYDRLLRKQAEFENYRKRQEREKKEVAYTVRTEIIREFLPVADACERALKALSTRESSLPNAESFRSGVELIYRQFMEILARFNVQPIEAVGQSFDPLLHHAILREETDRHPENQILDELQTGYTLEHRLLRPSQVKVAIPRSPQAGKNS